MRLLNKVNESLSSNEALKERLVLPHILNVVWEIENVIRTIASVG